ncbi:unnamed protein product [Caretta caretta]
MVAAAATADNTVNPTGQSEPESLVLGILNRGPRSEDRLVAASLAATAIKSYVWFKIAHLSEPQNKAHEPRKEVQRTESSSVPPEESAGLRSKRWRLWKKEMDQGSTPVAAVLHKGRRIRR